MKRAERVTQKTLALGRPQSTDKQLQQKNIEDSPAADSFPNFRLDLTPLRTAY